MRKGLKLDVGTAGELKFAFRRNGYTSKYVKTLLKGNFLRKVLDVMDGLAEIRYFDYIIDCAAEPYAPEDLSVESHDTSMGLWKWNPDEIFLYFSEKQKNGNVGGHELCKELANQIVFNTNVLEFLLAHPELIPEEWKDERVVFWGTTYNGAKHVRCLFWDGERWNCGYEFVFSVFHEHCPAAVCVQPLQVATKMTKDLTLDVSQAVKLKKAFQRNGFTNAHIKALTEGNFLNKVLCVLRGDAEIEYQIDCAASPFVPEGWTVESHDTSMGLWKWNPDEIFLYFSEKQKNGNVGGHELCKELANQIVFNTNVLEFLLAHPELIPEEWKDKPIFFWGTIYCDDDGDLCVRCLCWDDERWDWYCCWLDNDFDGDDLAAVCIQPSPLTTAPQAK